MLIKQVSVFIENKLGRLAEVTKVLAKNNININAMSISDTTDFGILRLIVNNPESALDILKGNDFTVSSTDVLAVAMPDTPGSLSKILEVIDKNAISIEYMYAFTNRKIEDAVVVLKIENPELAADILTKNNLRVLPASTVYKL
jgi:hypothetical protein